MQDAQVECYDMRDIETKLSMLYSFVVRIIQTLSQTVPFGIYQLKVDVCGYAKLMQSRVI